MHHVLVLLSLTVAVFPEILRRFDRHLDVIGRSPKTRHAYRYELLRWWTEYLFDADLELAEVRTVHVEEYLGNLPRNGSRRGDALRALRALFAWAHVEGEVDRNPVEHIPVPKRKLVPAPDITDEDIRRLLRAAFHREPRRGWAILLCYVTGARVGSLVAARPQDVHLGESPRIDLLEAKGDKPYSVPLDHAGVVAARHLIEEGTRRGTLSAAQSMNTLVGVGAERFRQWTHAAEQAAGLDRVWPHLLRHAASTRVARKTDPETWRRFMNHADLSQWSRYVAGTDERLRASLPLSPGVGTRNAPNGAQRGAESPHRPAGGNAAHRRAAV